MGQVIQIPPDDWYLLKVIKNSTELLRTRNDGGKYNKAIQKEMNIFKDIIDKHTIH